MDDWLLRTAPGFRLATAAVNPALVVLWLRLDGLGALMFRRGVRPNGAGVEIAEDRRWVPIPRLHLPGGGMQRVDFAVAARPAPRSPASAGVTPPQDSENAVDPDSRDSRQAAAFGAHRLRHLQRCHIVLVGAGRVGAWCWPTA